MKVNCLISIILLLIIIAPVMFVTSAEINEPKFQHFVAPANNSFIPQGLSPMAVEVTTNGQYAYICFDLSDNIFKINLTDFSVLAYADLSTYFPTECEVMSLDASEAKLFAYVPTWQKLVVIDTQTMQIIHIIDDINLIALVRSQN
jgi:hypothetical protein